MRETITFDDVLLVPKYSEIESRKKIDLSINLGKIDLTSLPGFFELLFSQKPNDPPHLSFHFEFKYIIKFNFLWKLSLGWIE